MGSVSKKHRFELEALEPRVLLSAGPLQAVGAMSAADAAPPAIEESIALNSNQADMASDAATSAEDIFAGVAQEDLAVAPADENAEPDLGNKSQTASDNTDAQAAQFQVVGSECLSSPSVTQTDASIASVDQNGPTITEEFLSEPPESGTSDLKALDVPSITEQLTEVLNVANAPPEIHSGVLTVEAGQKLAGSGTISAAIVVNGIISPGNSPGHLDSQSQTWTGGGSYDWEINKVAGGVADGHEGANPGWDFLSITGGLFIKATPANPFTINIKSLSGSSPGLVAGFNNALDYSWRLLATTNGITGFRPDLFALNIANFTNPLGLNGFFAITLGRGGKDLLLQFSPRPIVIVPGPIWVEEGPAPVLVPGGTDIFPTLDRTLGAGAVSSIVVDPTNAARVYVGTVNGGIWRTDNIGRQIPVDANLQFDPLAPAAPNVYTTAGPPNFQTVLGSFTIGIPSFTVGRYQYRFTYGNINVNESNASEAVTINVPAVINQINLSGIPTNGQVRNVYRTKAGGGDFFLVATMDISTTTFFDTVADSALGLMRTKLMNSPTWQQLNTDQLPSLSITALAISPLDSAGRTLGDPLFVADTLYAGTGALVNGQIPGYPAGLYKTTNAIAPVASMVNWSVRGGQIPLNGLTITAIVPTTQAAVGIPLSTNNQIVLVAAKWGGDQNVPGGVFRGADAGQNFTRIPMSTEVTAVKNPSATDLVIDPLTSGTIYAAVLPGISSTGNILKSPGGVFISTDWGITWANTGGALQTAINNIPIGDIVVNIRLAIHETSNTYAIYAGLVKGSEFSSAISAVFRSGDGLVWTQLGNAPPPIHNGGQGTTNFSIVADPVVSTIVYVGGDRRPNLYRGNAATGSWSALTDIGNPAPHPDSRAMVFLNPTTLLEADDGGLFQLSGPLTHNSGNDVWVALNGDLAVTEVYSVAYDNRNNVIMAGTQDNGSIEQIGRADAVDNDGDGLLDEDDERRFWRQVLGGNGNTQAVAHLADGNTVRYSLANNLQNNNSTSFVRRVFGPNGVQVGQTQLLQLARSGNSAILSGLNPDDRNYGFFTAIPYVVNASNPTGLILGFSQLYWGTQLGDVIVSMDPARAFPSFPVNLLDGRNRFDAIDSAINGGATAVYANRGKFILTSPDAANTPFNYKIKIHSTDPEDHIRDIAVHPTNWQSAWLINRSAVWATTDGGQNWRAIAATGLPSDLFSIEIVGTSLLIGASDGVYRADLASPQVLGKMAFSRFGVGLPRVTVRDLHYDSADDVLIAGTFGRGVWSDDNAPGTLSIDGTPGADVFKLARNADAPNLLDIFIKNPISQLFELTQSVELQSVADIYISGGGGDDTLIVDNANGLVSVAGTFQFNGGTGTDTLSILASPSAHILSLSADKLEFRAGGGRQTIQTGQVEQVPAATDPLISMATMLSALRGGLAEMGVWFRFLNDPEFLPNVPVVQDTLLGALSRGFGLRDTSLFRALIETGENAFLIQDIGGSPLPTLAALRLALDNLDSVPGNVILSINSTTGAPVFKVAILKSLSGSAEINLAAANDKISILGGGTITADIELHVEFGVDSDGFYIVGGNSGPELTISNIDFSGELEATGHFGFLEVVLSNATLTADPNVRLNIFLHDPGTDIADGLIRLDELGTIDSSLVTAQLVGNPNAGLDDMVLTGDFSVAAILPGQGEPFTLGTATVAFKWNDISDIAGVRVTAMTTGAQRLMDFLNLDAAEALSWLQRAGDWLGQFRDSSLFDLTIPFASGKTVGDAFDFSKAWVDKIYSQFVRLDVVGESPVPLVINSGKITSDAKFTLQIGDDAAVRVIIPATVTNNNLSLQDLVDDFNMAFNSLPALSGKVEATINNGKLAIVLIPGNAATITLTAESATNSIVTEIGFGNEQGGIEIPLFDSFQELAAKLMSILDPDGPGVGPYDLTVGYDPIRSSVTLGLKLNYASTTTVSPSFEIPLGELGDVSGGGTLTLTAGATLAVVLGFDLRAKVAPELIPAFTPANGQLLAPANFSLVLDGGAPIFVVVPALAPTPTSTIATLAAHFNNVFAGLLYQGQPLNTFVRAWVPAGGTKMFIRVVNEDNDGDGKWDHNNEDSDGDGQIDLGEDLNNNGVLDSGEDMDGDGRLDTNEDLDGDGFMDVAEDTNANSLFETKLGVINSLQIVGANSDPIVTELGFGPSTTVRTKVRGLFLDQYIEPGSGPLPYQYIEPGSGPLPFVSGTLTLATPTKDLAVTAVLAKFVVISTSGGTAQGKVSISTSLKNPNPTAPPGEEHRLYLKQLFKYLNKPSKILEAPTITTFQTIQLELKNITAGFVGFNPIPAGAAIVLAAPNVTSLRNSDGDFVVTTGFDTEVTIPAAGTGTGIYVTYPDLSGLFHFSCFDIPTLLHMLDALVSKLDDFQRLVPFLDQKLPLINFSVSDLVSYGGQFATWVDELRKDPTGTLQTLELKIEAALNLAPNAFSLTVEDTLAPPATASSGPANFFFPGGNNDLTLTSSTVDMTQVKISFIGVTDAQLVDPVDSAMHPVVAVYDPIRKILKVKLQAGVATANDVKAALLRDGVPFIATLNTTAETNTGFGVVSRTVLKIHFAPMLSFGESYPLNFDLAALVELLPNSPLKTALQSVTELVQVDGSGDLGVSASASITVDFGIDLTNPCGAVPFLYDSTNLALKARVLGTNLEFGLALGSAGLFVADGTVTLDADGDPATQDDASFVVKLRDNNGDGRHYFKPSENFFDKENMTVTLAAGVSAILPLFAPLATMPLGGNATDNNDGYPENYLVVNIPDLKAVFLPNKTKLEPNTATTATALLSFKGDNNNILFTSGAMSDVKVRFKHENLADPQAPTLDWNSVSTTVTITVKNLETTANAVVALIMAEADHDLLTDKLPLGFAATLAAPDHLNGGNTGLASVHSPVIIIAPDFTQLFASIDLCALITSQSSPLLAGLDKLLAKVQEGLTNNVLGNNFPLVGKGFAKAGDFIKDFREGLLAKLRAQLAEAGGDPIELIVQSLQKGIYDVLGPPGGLDILVKVDGTAVTGPEDLDIMANCGAGTINFDLRLKKSVKVLDTTKDPIAVDIGVPGFALKVEGNVVIELGFDFHLKFGISKADGFYFDTSDPKELEITLNASIPGLHAQGQLFFLQLDVMDNLANPSFFNAGFSVNVVGPPSHQDKLRFADFGNLDFSKTFLTNLSATANVNLDLVVRFTKEANFPELLADFQLFWQSGGGAPNIAFKNIRLDLGNFLSDYLQPLLARIQKVTEPLQPVVDVLTFALPGLSQMAGRPVTLLDIAEAFGYITPGTHKFINQLAAITKLINSLHVGNGATLMIPLGSFTLSGDDPTNAALIQAGSDTNGDDLLKRIEDAAKNTEAPPAGSEGASFQSNAKEFGKTLGSMDNFKFPWLKKPMLLFPLFLGKPVTLVEYVMPTLEFKFTYAASFLVYPAVNVVIKGIFGAKIDLTFGYDTLGLQKFFSSSDKHAEDLLEGFFIKTVNDQGTVVPQLTLTGTFLVGVSVGLFGVEAGILGGIQAVFGFYLHDNNLDGKVRIKEIVENAKIDPRCIFEIHAHFDFILVVFVKALGKEFEFEIVRVKLFEIDLVCPTPMLANFPPNSTGKPFDGTGTNGVLRLNIGPEAAHREHGNTDDGNDVVTVTHVTGDALGETVLVNWNGYTQEFSNVKSITANGGAGNDVIDARGVKVKVTLEGGDGQDTVYLSDGAGSTGDGGDGDDTITAGSGILATGVTIHGDGGNDRLIGGSKVITIYGDGGMDNITGSPEADFLYGGDGDDIVHGGPGKDHIIGNGGNDSLFGEEDDDVLVGDEGVISPNGLTVTGISGLGNDLISGGGASDIIFGGWGDDFLFGGAFLEAGVQQLASEDKYDFMDGGAGNDVIFAEDAFGPQPGQPAGSSVGDRVFYDTNGSGEFDADETGIGGVKVKLYEVAGPTLVGTTTTDANGFYQFAGLSAATSYYVEFTSPAGLHFTGTVLTVTLTGTLTTASTAAFTLQPDETNTAHDAGLAGPPVISISNVTVKEGKTGLVAAIFNVALSAPATIQMTVDYEFGNSTWNDTARASFYTGTTFNARDFLPLGQTELDASGMPFLRRTGRLVFEPGTRVQQIAVLVNGDTTDEDNEQFRVRLTNAFNASLDDPSGAGYIEGIGTIVDDDAPPSITISDGVLVDASVLLDINTEPLAFVDSTGIPVKTEDITNPTYLRFTVRLSNLSSHRIKVDYRTAGVVADPDEMHPVPSAIAGTDYQSVLIPVMLTFNPGELEKSFVIAVSSDVLDEDEERFYVVLENVRTEHMTSVSLHPANATMSDGTAVGTIHDDDLSPTLSINDASVTEGHIGTIPATFTVTLSAASGREVRVQWATVRGTAILFPEAVDQTGDFEGASGTLVFAPGITSRTITANVYGDTLVEGPEYLFLNLLTTTNASYTDNQGVLTIEEDDTDPNANIGPWSIQFSSANYTVGENGGFAEITLLRSHGSSEPLAVYFTVNGSAIAGSDYVGNKGMIKFGAGETEKSFLIPILDDSLPEGDETVRLVLLNPTGGAVRGLIDTATLTIQDNEPLPELSISKGHTLSGIGPITEGDLTTVFMYFTVTLSASRLYSIPVTFATSDGTAIANSDYLTTSSPTATFIDGTNAFGPGDTTKTIRVSIPGGTVAEPTEKFFVNLLSATGAQIVTSQGVGTIEDNDTVPISGRVFLDVDANGVFDGSDRWLKDVAVKVKDYRNDDLLTNVLPTSGTDASGVYTADVRLGNVTVTVDEASLALVGMKLTTNNNSQTIKVTGTFPVIPDIGFTPSLDITPPVDGIQDGAGYSPDVVYGGTGNDLIHGGGGDDWLTGGHWLGAGGAWALTTYDATLLVTGAGRIVLNTTLLLAALRSISGVVWNDLDGAGIHDSNELGLGGLRVNLFDQQYVLIASTLTNASGGYQFDNLTPTTVNLTPTYFVQFVAPSNRSFSPLDVGQTNPAIDITNDSDADTLTGFTAPITLGLDPGPTHIDAGLKAWLPAAGPGPWSVQFEFGAYNVREDAGSAGITILRTPGSIEPVASFFTFNGLAVAGIDYVGVRKAIEFGGLTTLRTVLVPVLKDAFPEGLETVFLFLRNPTGGPALGSRSVAVLLIFDSDCQDDDQIFGGQGDDVIAGDFAIITGSTVSDVTPLGGSGDDKLIGGQGGDLMFGQGGNDELDPGSGNDSAYGGEANDTLVADVGLPDLLDGGSGADRVFSARDVNMGLTDAVLTHSNGSVFNLVSIEEATLIGGASNTVLNATGFSGTTLLDAGVGVNVITGGTGFDTVISNANVNFTLTDAALSRSDGGVSTLSSIDKAQLTGAASVNVFNVSGWTGQAELDGRGGTDSIVSSNDDSVVLLSDALLLRSNRGNIQLTSIERAELTGGMGNNILDATNFTGATILDGGAGNDALRGGSGPDRIFINAGNDDVQGGSGSDTLVSSGDTNFTLNDGSFSRTDLVSATLGSIELAVLTGGVGNNMLNTSGFTGSATLDGRGGTNLLTGGSGNDLLIVNGGVDNVVDGGGGSNVLISSGDANYVLTNTSLSRSDIAGSLILTLSSIQEARLTGGASTNEFTVSGWTHLATLDGAGNTDMVVATNNANFTLTDLNLMRSGRGTVQLLSIEAAVLTGDTGSDTLDASGFSGDVTLSGNAGADTLTGGSGHNILNGGGDADTFVVNAGLDYTIDGGTGINILYSTGDVDFTLTNTELFRSDGIHATLNSTIQQAHLTGGRGQNKFTLTGWTREAWLDGGVIDPGVVPDLDTVIIERDASFTLTNTDITIVPVTGVAGPVHLLSIEAARLTGGASSNTLIATGFNGAVTLDGAGGTNTLTGSSGRNEFIVNTGQNTLNPGAGHNVVISSGNLDFALTDVNLSRAGLVSATFTGAIQEARLTGGVAQNNFTVTGWSGEVWLDGGVVDPGVVPDLDTVIIQRDASFTFTNTGITVLPVTGLAGPFHLLSIEAARVTGGVSPNTLNASGFSGAATLEGGDGADVLIGGSGPDILIGGLGNDTLIGGAGSDTYVFNLDLVLGTDTINDVGGVLDKIDFSPTVIVTVAVVNLSSTSAQPIHVPNLTLTLGAANIIEFITSP